MKRKKRKSGNARPRFGVLVMLLAVIAGLLGIVLVLFPRTAAGMPEDSLLGTTQDSGDSGRSDELRGSDGRNSETTVGISSSKSSGSASSTTAVYHGRRMKVALVIDDAGNDMSGLDSFLEFKGKLTIAVLPELANSARSAERAHQAGKEVILHLPMQPLGDENPGPGVIEVTFDREEIYRVLEADLATVPFAVGVNNHMGSLATQDKRVMDSIFSYLQRTNKYFLDSRTVQTTVSRDAADAHGVSFIERNYFLDIKTDTQSIDVALKQGLSYAAKNGFVVMIGHVQHKELAALLKENYTEYLNQGVEFVFVSDLIEQASGGVP